MESLSLSAWSRLVSELVGAIPAIPSACIASSPYFSTTASMCKAVQVVFFDSTQTYPFVWYPLTDPEPY